MVASGIICAGLAVSASANDVVATLVLSIIIILIFGNQRRPSYGWVFLFAFGVRVLVAILTEGTNIFPDYYFKDSQHYERIALLWRNAILTSDISGIPLASPGHLAYGAFLAVQRFITGEILFPKVMNSLFGALAVVRYLDIYKEIVGDRHSLAGLRGYYYVAILLSIWPSNVLWTSQNLRDSILLWALASFVYEYLLFSRSGRRTWTRLLVYGALIGILRTYIVFAIGFSIAVHSLISVFRIAGTKRMVRSIVLLIFGCILAYFVILVNPRLDSITFDALNRVRPYSDHIPEHQTSAVFREVEFRSWFDVVLFIPRGVFTIIALPFPGLSSGQSTGVLLASLENVVFLFILLLGAMCWYRVLPGNVTHAWLATFILSIVVIYAYVAPDLGGIMRYKLQFSGTVVVYGSYGLSRLSASRVV